jgi:GT2 family glycosyltransferase
MISVIIATYNRADRLRFALTALAKQEGGFEVIVADDGSDNAEETLAVVEGHWPMPVRYCWHQHDGFGLARTRNEGARLAKGDVFLFLDSDILLRPGALQAAWELFNRNPHSPVGGYYAYLPPMSISGDLVPMIWHVQTEGILPDMRETWHKTGRIGVDVFDYEFEPLWSPLCLLGAIMMIPRYCFEKTGGFDEHFKEYGGEDAEMSLALISHGFPIRYSRRLSGYHMHHQPNQNANPQSEQRHLRYLAEKYPEFWLAPGQPNPLRWGRPVSES